MNLGTFKKLLTLCGYAPQGSGSTTPAYNPAGVAITGGSINGTRIGNITPADGAFTSLNATSANVFGLFSAQGVNSTTNGQLAGIANTGVNVNASANWSSVTFYDSTRGSDNKTADIVFQSGVVTMRFKNDAGNNATPWLSATGGYGSGIASIASTSGAGAWTHTGAMVVTQSSGNGVTFTPAANGSSPTIASAGVNTNVGLNISTQGAGGINLNSNTAITGAMSVSGTLTSVGGVPTDAGSKSGVAVVVKVLGLVTQAANVASQTLYAVPAGQDGTYRVSLYAEVTQAATTSSTLPNVGLGWTSRDANTAVALPTATPTNSANALGALGNTTQNISCKAGTNITIQTSGYVSSGATPMQYAVRAVVEYLGA